MWRIDVMTELKNCNNPETLRYNGKIAIIVGRQALRPPCRVFPVIHLEHDTISVTWTLR